MEGGDALNQLTDTKQRDTTQYRYIRDLYDVSRGSLPYIFETKVTPNVALLSCQSVVSINSIP